LPQPQALFAESHCCGFSGAERYPNAAVRRESAIGAMPLAFLSRKFYVQNRKGRKISRISRISRIKSKMK
jgi:hypothetical protein